MELKPENMFINVPFLQFASYLGVKYNARVKSWGRDTKGNRKVGGKNNSWHLWARGANGIDLKPQDCRDLSNMAVEAEDYGYQVAVYRTTIHIEVGW